MKVQIDNLIPPIPTPDYEAEVLAPLRQAQELARQQEAKRLADIEAEKARVSEQRSLEAAQGAVREVQPSEVSAPITGDIQGIIVKWANHYGVDPETLLRVAKCESTFNPLAINRDYYAGGGNPAGLFQFLPDTFNANATRAGLSNPNIWSADDSAHVAAYMFSIGQSGQWACK